jgi:hypothetical protein
MFKSGECADHGRCWSLPPCFSNHYWTVLAVWMEALSSWKSASLFGNNVWNMGCTWLPNLSTYFPAEIRPWSVILGPTEYNDFAAQTIPEPPSCFTVGTRHSGLWASLGVPQTQTLPEIGNSVKDDPSEHITLAFQLSDVQVIWSWYHHLLIWALL